MALFQNRQEAAEELATALHYIKADNPIVLGLANGGVPVAEVIARKLDAPLDILLMERIAAPHKPDHIIGAVDEHGRISTIHGSARWHHVSARELIEPAREAFRRIQMLRSRYRSILPELDVRNRTVILVSQGVATGAKMLGAIASVRDRGARKIIVAAPAGATKATWHLNEVADSVVIPHRPTRFTTVRDFYREYTPVTPDLVDAIISRWVTSRPEHKAGVRTIEMKIQNMRGKALSCEIDLPPGCARGSGPYPAVIFAHGHKSDGRNPRNVPISQRLAKRDIIGVRFDFTGHGRSEGEFTEATTQQMFNDLQVVVGAARNLTEVDPEQIGFCGSGTGGMLCLELTKHLEYVRTIVIRSPLTGGEIFCMREIKAPTLVLLAGLEESINRDETTDMPSCHELVEIPDATQLFNDPISKEMMVGASVEWLDDHLTGIPTGDVPTIETMGTHPEPTVSE
jgi:putative phosphoribosyl transferase